MDSDTTGLLEKLFPFTFTVDSDLLLSQVSPRLGDLCPAAVSGLDFMTVFRCHRPRTVSCYEELLAAENTLFLLISHDEQLALKGQMLVGADGKRLHFAGMPWLEWMNQKAPQVRLHLGDFPKLDSQMDRDLHLISQQSMVNDLESLNEKLAKAEKESRDSIKVQSELFAVMSHEMRTPLNGVISALSLLSEECSSAEREKITEVANESANNLLSVINYALDYSKIDAGKMPLQMLDFSLTRMLDSVIAVTEGRAKEKEIELSYFMASDVQKLVVGDEEKIRQVLINIVGNAIKFTEVGAVNVFIEQKENLFSFITTDTGVGIAKKDFPKLFNPFWGKTKSDSETSTGLGLNIVMRLVELMSGEVRFESEEGVGTNFRVEIPLEVGKLDCIPEKESAMDALPSTFSGRVLLVDDNQVNLMLGRMILENRGVSVRTASDGEEAVNIIKDVSFDLVLMDISMPVMDGMAAMQEINLLPSPPPVVALTANVGNDYAKRYFDAGFKGYLKKPLEQAAMVSELSFWLKPSKLDVAGAIVSGKMLFNSDVVEELIKQIGNENYLHVRSLFIDESQSRITSLSNAWLRRDLEKVRKEAHALSSSVASFGCEDLSWRLKKIEAAACLGDATEIVRYMTDIDSAYKDALGIVLQYGESEEPTNR